MSPFNIDATGSSPLLSSVKVTIFLLPVVYIDDGVKYATVTIEF